MKSLSCMTSPVCCNPHRSLRMPDETVMYAIRHLDSKLDSVLRLLNAAEVSEWLNASEVIPLLGVSERHLRQLVQDGTIHGDAIRNVGTQKKARYKFHRKKVLDQYLSRA